MILEKVRILHAELHGFFENLDTEPTLSVHGMRKRSKYLRALLKSNPDEFQQSLVILKNLSRMLAPYRDAQVMIETFEKHCSNNDPLENSSVMDRLQANPFHEDPTPDLAEIHRLNDLMAQLAIEIRGYSVDIPEASFDAYLESSITRCQNKLILAKSSPDPETVHEWRKKSKHVWYLLRCKYGEDTPEMLVGQFNEQ